MSNPTHYERLDKRTTPIDPHAPVIDFDKSEGPYLHDKALGRRVLDFASHYASLPLGYNHPGFFDADYERKMLRASRIKIANLDVLSDELVEFFDSFQRVVGAPGFDRLFFIDGGALAVENAMKIAFDWKTHRNLRRGRGERGQEILHFREAFHGRSGYTLSVTNTDPNKTRHFPKFPWPRVINPKMRFPFEGSNREETLEDERAALNEIAEILSARADDIAAILVEPIQGEGGDNHFRPEFLSAVRDLAHAHDALLIFDEVQTGMGMTGKPWAWQSLGVEPDLYAFAKKAQVGGVAAGPRVMEEEKNCFTVPSRISSTWGGSLADMVRCQRYLEICEEEGCFGNAALRGREILGLLQGVADRTELIHNVRGRGLFIAFDLEYPEVRPRLMEELYRSGLMVLGCGPRSVRFRPHLNVGADAIAEAVGILEECLLRVEAPVTHSI